ncbi:MAG: hypothetical protein KGZ85_03570 [Ignavibacterium sp.]|nr:hypothetical protein [Ignavibacterium sp.]
MGIIIHQAICGEQNKAWELINTTLEDIPLAKKIAFQVDLQDSPPSGLQWLPVLRGFSFGNHFLLIKTYPDNSPEVRNGRVFSHCLIIDKSDLSIISDVSHLLTFFSPEMNKAIQLAPITLTTAEQNIVELKDNLQKRFNKVIQFFLRFSEGVETIIWIGQKNYEIAVSKLWQMLSPQQRENFYFGINFNPAEVAKNKLVFVTIPENLESKFTTKGFTTICKEDSIELTDFADQYLAREENAIRRIESFISSIEAVRPNQKDISVIAKGVTTFENIDEEKDIKLLNTLSNIISKYSPNPSQGILTKSKLVKRISLLAEKAEDSEIFLLRNFHTSAFKGSKELFSTAIDKWCNNFLLNEKQNQKINYAPFIHQILAADQSNWLVSSVTDKLNEFLFKVNKISAKVIWSWILSDITILKKISDKLDNTKPAETYLYETLPILNEEILLEIKSFAIKRKWFRLYATILKTQYPFEEAINEQLKIDSEMNHYEGIEIITKSVKSNCIISVALSNGDRRLIQLSGKLCNKDKKLLSSLEIENINWQEIWLASINNGNDIYDGIKEPLQTTYKLFNLLISGKSISEGLLIKIGETDYANVLDFPNRSEIWDRLPSKVKTKFLEKTSASLLESLSRDSTYQVPTDKELSDYIVSDGISLFLYYNRNNIKSVLPILNTYTQIPQQMIKDYVYNYSGKIDVVDSVQLGKLVISRNSSKVAQVIQSKVKHIPNLKYALIECHSLLGIFDKASLVFSGIINDSSISEDEWWQSFSDIAIRLYEEGPTENEIWKQSDGHKYDLITGVSGKESWLNALIKLRNGGCKDITPKKLLKAMINEFPQNQELRTLKDLWNKL